MSKTKGEFAPLVFLSEAVDSLSIPIRTAEKWVEPADFPAFVEELDARVRALADLFEDYLTKHPEVLQRREEPGEPESVGPCVQAELAYTRKNLGLINQIGKAGRKEDDPGKSGAEIVREQIRNAFLGPETATDFATEIEELRKLRSGEPKPGPSAKPGGDGCRG